MIKLEVNGEVLSFDNGIRLADLNKNKNYLCAKVNNRLRELNYVVYKDAKIEFLDESDFYGMKVYESSLRYVILMALHNISENKQYKFSNSVSRSFMLTSTNPEECLTSELLDELEQEVERIISLDLPIKRAKLEEDDAIQVFTKLGFKDKIKMLDYRDRNKVNLYECEGYYNYLYSYMVPSTGYLKDFGLKLYNPGILVSYPRSDIEGKLPDFEPSLSYDAEITKSDRMGASLNLNTVSKVNQVIEQNRINDLINISENIHNRELVYLADIIEKNIRNIKLILVAGPSSSGKTTFTNRLRTELESRAIVPVMISLDNYYKDRKETPLDEKGEPDFESLYSLDIERFNEDMLGLIQGKEIALREFDFKNKQVIEHGKVVKLGKNTPILIEGIHALNDELHNLIPKFYKFKIYISPVLSMNLDNHNPISITDMRLLRRIVRDKKYRNTNASETFKMWNSVRSGEFKWIYPYADDVDYVFNSSLFYELGVMKNFAIEALSDIDSDSEYYIDANRLLKFLRYIIPIEETMVPSNSILREFIGGSIY